MLDKIKNLFFTKRQDGDYVVYTTEYSRMLKFFVLYFIINLFNDLYLHFEIIDYITIVFGVIVILNLTPIIIDLLKSFETKKVKISMLKWEMWLKLPPKVK